MVCLAISHGLPDIMHNEAENGRKSAILNLKVGILSYSNGLSIWHDLQNITHIK